MVEPIRPEDVAATKKAILPPEVITCWNNMIALKYSDGEARIELRDIIASITKAMNTTSKRVLDEDWLEVEDIYRAAGWKVVYDRPGYDENYEPFFIFSKRKSRD
jgi:hypothetical protein